MNIKELVLGFGIEEDRAEYMTNVIIKEVIMPRYNVHMPVFKCPRCGASWHDKGEESVCYNCGNLVKEEIE